MSDSHLDAYDDFKDLRNEGTLVHLDVGQCLDLLAGQAVGRVAMNDPRGPLVFPVNYVVDGGTILFRTTMGSKLAAADDHEMVAFQVDGIDHDLRTGWSVLVRGRLVEVTRPDEIDRVRDLQLNPFAGGDRRHFVRVMPASVTGRSTGLEVSAPSAGDDGPDAGATPADAPPATDSAPAADADTDTDDDGGAGDSESATEAESTPTSAEREPARSDAPASPPSAWTPSSPRPPHPPPRRDRGAD